MALGYRSDIFNAVEQNTVDNSDLAHQRRMAYDALSDEDKAIYNTIQNSRALLLSAQDGSNVDDGMMYNAALKIAEKIYPSATGIARLKGMRPGKAAEDFTSGREALQYMIDMVDGKESGNSKEADVYFKAREVEQQEKGEAFNQTDFDVRYNKTLEAGGRVPGVTSPYGEEVPFQATVQEGDAEAETTSQALQDRISKQISFMNRWKALTDAGMLSVADQELIRRALISGDDKVVEYGGREITLEENAAFQLDRGEGTQTFKKYANTTTLGGPGANISSIRQSLRYIGETSGLQDTMTKDWSTAQLLDYVSAESDGQVALVLQMMAEARGGVTSEQWWADAGTRFMSMTKRVAGGTIDAASRMINADIRPNRVKRFAQLRDLQLDISEEAQRQHRNSIALSLASEPMTYENYGWFKSSALGAVEQLPIWGALAVGSFTGPIGGAAVSSSLIGMYYAESYDTMIANGVDSNVAMVAASASALGQFAVERLQYGILSASARKVFGARAIKNLVGNVADGFLKRNAWAVAGVVGGGAAIHLTDTLTECVEEGVQKTIDDIALNIGKYITDGTYVDGESNAKEMLIDSLRAGLKEGVDVFGTMLLSVGGARLAGSVRPTYNIARTRSLLRTTLDATRAITGAKTNGVTWGETQFAAARETWAAQPNNKERINALKKLGLSHSVAEDVHRKFKAQDILAERYSKEAAAKLIDTTLSSAREFASTEEGKTFLKTALKTVFGENVDVTDITWSDGNRDLKGIGIHIGERIIPIAIDDDHQIVDDVENIDNPSRNVATSIYASMKDSPELNGMSFEEFAKKWEDADFRKKFIEENKLGKRGEFNAKTPATIAIQVENEDGTKRTEYIPAAGVILLNWNDASTFRSSYKSVVHETLHAIARIVRDSGLISKEEKETLQLLLPKAQVESEEFDEDETAYALERELGYLISRAERDAGAKTQHKGVRGWIERFSNMIGNIVFGGNVIMGRTEDGVRMAINVYDSDVTPTEASTSASYMVDLLANAKEALDEVEAQRANYEARKAELEEAFGASEQRYSISGIYTGAAADYAHRLEDGTIVNGPSLHYVGTGEGAQVYGWGLYGSSQRGVAEGYAEEGTAYRSDAVALARHYYKDYGSRPKAYQALLEETRSPSAINYREKMDALWLLSGKAGTAYKNPLGNLYEQTFFTDRAPGDESHLLKWYKPVSKEQRTIIDSALKENGVTIRIVKDGPEYNRGVYYEKGGKLLAFINGATNAQFTGEIAYNLLAKADVLGSPKAASEFLARAGIDGIKYPVNSYGGKGVKDGDVVGWNYVSFRDDNIRVDHKWVDGEQRYSVSAAQAQREYDDVVARYTNHDGTKKDGWLKAPNGKPTNLTERQWVQVRTPSFKKWFGDWEALAIKSGWYNVVDIEDILTLATTDVSDIPVLIDKNALKTAFKSWGNVVNINDGRNVVFPTASAGKMKKVGLVSGALNKLFESSRRAWSEKDDGRHNNIAAVHHYINKAHTSKGDVYVHFTVREDFGSNSGVHAATVSSVEVYNEGAEILPGKNLATSTPFTDLKLAHFFANVNPENVSKVVDENGEPKVMYHGSPSVFNVFESRKMGSTGTSKGKGFYFTPSKDLASGYMEDGGNLFEVFLNIRKPLNYNKMTMTRAQVRKLIEAIDQKMEDAYGREMGILTDFGEINYEGRNVVLNRAVDAIHGNDSDVDAIAELVNMTNQYDIVAEVTRDVLGFDGIIPSDTDLEIVGMNPNQIKSATDNIGTFDVANDDIRYSIAARRPDLVGLHNMSEEGLKGADALGGFAMPSIAITKDSMGHNEFGDISLLMRTSAYDPKSNRWNKIYSRDAWTPTFPGIVNKPNIKHIEDVSERLLKTLPENVRKAIGHNETYRLLYEDGIQEEFNSSNTAGDAYGTNAALKAAYLIAKGETIEPVMTPRTFLGRSNSRVLSLGEDGLRIINETIGDLLISFHSISGAERMDWIEQHRGAIEAAFIDAAYDSRIAKNPDVAEFTKEEVVGNLFKKNPLGFADVIDLADAVAKLRKAIAKGEADAQIVDEYATKRAIGERVPDYDPDFKAWLDEQYGDPILARGIRNNKNYYTSSGKRRSWDALHDPVTLANVVKVMLSKQRAQGEGFLGANPFGLTAAKLKSLKDVIKNEALLKELPKEEMDAIRDGFIQAFSEISERYSKTWKYRDSNPYTAVRESDDSLLDAWADSKGSFEGLKRELNGYGRTADDDLIRDFKELMDGIAKFPTKYFEAKPMRGVGFDEVAAAIIPNNASDETREILNRRGVKMFEYEAGNETSRLAALNMAADEVEDTRFSITALDTEHRDLYERYQAGDEAALEEARKMVMPLFDEYASTHTISHDEAALLFARIASQYADDHPFVNFGIRVDDRLLVPDSIFPNSHELFQDQEYDEDGNGIYPMFEHDSSLFDAGELDGTSTLGVDVSEDIEATTDEILTAIKGNAYFGQYVYLVAGWDKGSGYDPGERLISDATVLSVLTRVGGKFEEIGFTNKSADLFTFDDAGNLIPLSERFNLENGDVRFSVASAEIRSNIGTTNGVYTTSIDTQNPKTKDGRNTVIFRRALEDSINKLINSPIIAVDRNPLPEGIVIGDKNVRYTVDEKKALRKFIEDRVAEISTTVENDDIGDILINGLFAEEFQRHGIANRIDMLALSSAKEIAKCATFFVASPNEEKVRRHNRKTVESFEYGFAFIGVGDDVYLVMSDVVVNGDKMPYYDQKVVAKIKAESLKLGDHLQGSSLINFWDSASDEIYDNRFRIILQACKNYFVEKVDASNQKLSVASISAEAARVEHERMKLEKAQQKASDAGIRLSIGSLYHGRSPDADVLITREFIERIVADKARASKNKKPSVGMLNRIYRDLGVTPPKDETLAASMKRIQTYVNEPSKSTLESYMNGLGKMSNEELQAYSRGVQDASLKWTQGVSREVLQAAKEAKQELESLSGITPNVIIAENGFDPLETIVLANDRALTEEEMKARNERLEQARNERDKEVIAVLDGVDTEADIVTPEHLDELEARRKALREAMREYEKARAEAAERNKEEAPQETPFTDESQEDEAVEEEKLEEIKAELFKGIAYDIDDPMSIKEFVSMLQYLTAEHTLGHAPSFKEMKALVRDPNFVREFALTASLMVDKLSKKLCYSSKRDFATRALKNLASAKTAHQAQVFTINALTHISLGRIRETKAELYTRMKKALKKGIERGRFSTNREDLDRKVTGDLEVVLREIRNVLDMGPTKLRKYRENAVNLRMRYVKDEANENEDYANTSWRDLMKADMQIYVADEFGGWRDKTLGEIEALASKIEEMVETGKDDLAEKREAYANKVQSILRPILQACLESQTKFGGDNATKLREKVAQWLENKVVAMQKLLMSGLVAGRLDPQVRLQAEEAINSIVRAFDHAAAVKHTKLMEYNEKLEEIDNACYGSHAECVKAHSELIPEDLNEILTNRVKLTQEEKKEKGKDASVFVAQRTRLTRGQAIQLYASIIQEDYAENTRLWQRDGEAFKKLTEYLTENDIDWVAHMSKFFGDTFPELQACFKRITGRTIGTTESYYPVKMNVPRRGLAGKVRVYSNFYASMEPRRRNALDFDESVSALDMVQSRINEYAHMLAYGELGIIINDIFGDPTLIKAIKNSKGNEYLRRLQSNLLDALIGVETSDRESAQALAKVAQWTTLTAMSLNLGVAIKQFSGIATFANEIGLKGTKEAMHEFFANDGWEWEYLKTTPEYKARYQVGYNPDMVTTVAKNRASRLARGYRYGMAVQTKADELVARPFLVGVFRLKYADYVKSGMDELKAREYAATEAFGLVGRTQQSGDVHNRHHLVRSSSWARLLSTFRTTPIQMVQYEAKALASFLRGEEGAGRNLLATVAINHVLSPLIFEMLDAVFQGIILGGFFDEDEREKLAKRLAWQLVGEFIFGPSAAIPIIGGVTSWILDYFSKGKESALSAYNARKFFLEIPVANTATNFMSYGAELLHDLATLDFAEMQGDMEDILYENLAPYRHMIKAVENFSGEELRESN